MIPYGADRVDDADPAHVRRLGLEPGGYAVVICRPEPGHSLVEIVRAFSRRPRPVRLVILGHYRPDRSAFHRRVIDAAGPDVIFPGAIYDRDTVQSLRLYTRLYVHGHFLGGTNPSLVESLGAGAPVLARDNRFNRWVAGSAAHFFSDEETCGSELDRLLEDDAERSRMSAASRQRHAEQFTWARTLGDYEKLLTSWLPC
jgi:glycosyltransferase involved in cell wall biosynthesis